MCKVYDSKKMQGVMAIEYGVSRATFPRLIKYHKYMQSMIIAEVQKVTATVECTHINSDKI